MFLVFIVSSLFAWMVYVAYETVLPVSLVDTHGYAEAAWGLLLVVNPVLVTLFQLRLTRAVERVPAAPKLVAAMLLMGLPFLLFGLSAADPRRCCVLVLFVIGEMLWVPTSQSIVAGLAPEDLRGAYMGAFGSMAAAGFALAPFTGLQVRAAYGDDAMWAMFAGSPSSARCSAIVACRGVARVRGLPLLYWRREEGGAAGDPRPGRRPAETPRDRRRQRRSRRIWPRARWCGSRCRCACGTSGRRPTATSPRSAGRCRTWCGCARSTCRPRLTSYGSRRRGRTRRGGAGCQGGSARRWDELVRGWSFDEVNDLIDRHNRWYPAESRLPMDPLTGDYALVNGEDYRRAPLDAAWALERFRRPIARPAPRS